ncbi:DUF4333 domain-containing protein [Mycolicibacterium goodii]
MADQVRLTATVPDGWISVDPQVVNEDAASMVLLRRADLDSPFTTNITVSELATDAEGDIAAFAESYRQDLASRTINLTVLREGALSDTPPRQYAQDLQFSVEINGRVVEIRQSQFLLEIPTGIPDSLLLLQLLYSAPADVYDVAKAAVVEFMDTIEARQASDQNHSAAAASNVPGIRKEHLEARVKELLERSVGQQADAVVCNGDLRAEVGAVQRCALVVGQDKLGVTVTVSHVEGENVKFDIQVDNKPMV